MANVIARYEWRLTYTTIMLEVLDDGAVLVNGQRVEALNGAGHEHAVGVQTIVAEGLAEYKAAA
jgi:hypothetical protein